VEICFARTRSQISTKSGFLVSGAILLANLSLVGVMLHFLRDISMALVMLVLAHVAAVLFINLDVAKIMYKMVVRAESGYESRL
jgi:hypothetical protein